MRNPEQFLHHLCGNILGVKNHGSLVVKVGGKLTVSGLHIILPF